MQMKAIIPLIDLTMLTLGLLSIMMSQMKEVTALEFEITLVGKGAAVVQTGDFMMLTLSIDNQLILDGEPIRPKMLFDRVSGREIILRVERDVNSHHLLTLLNKLIIAGAVVKPEVERRRTSIETRSADQ